MWVVVAIDDFYGHRVYTIDDSTGECIECSVETPKPPKPGAQGAKEVARGGAASSSRTATAQGTATTSSSVLAADIDVGMVVDVKGRVKLFRDRKQIKIQKVQRIGSTAQEVQFWGKIQDFRRDVLSRPWLLDKRDVRRAKKQHLADVDADERRRRRKERHRLLQQEEADRRRGVGKADRHRATTTTDLVHRQSPAKSKGGRTHGDGQYDALGL
ncbi:hypothetical protein SLS62_007305 [Diatrype stigma]|uniref:CST complex subunit Stn1 N-terminal domain-containing protein n=1 Tax=Diatrype stigma TaxID=117547 RepID=A0AAN9YQV9_9PEZI